MSLKEHLFLFLLLGLIALISLLILLLCICKRSFASLRFARFAAFSALLLDFLRLPMSIVSSHFLILGIKILVSSLLDTALLGQIGWPISNSPFSALSPSVEASSSFSSSSESVFSGLRLPCPNLGNLSPN